MPPEQLIALAGTGNEYGVPELKKEEPTERVMK